jgi:hypothetical protein
LLDGGGGGIAFFANGFEQGRGQAQFIKCHGINLNIHRGGEKVARSLVGAIKTHRAPKSWRRLLRQVQTVAGVRHHKEGEYCSATIRLSHALPYGVGGACMEGELSLRFMPITHSIRSTHHGDFDALGEHSGF